MDYTPEQREIIARIGDISRRIEETEAQHHAAQVAEVDGLQTINNGFAAAIASLRTALERSAELGALYRQHGDLWREFLDTL